VFYDPVKAEQPDGDRAGVELTVLGKRRIQYEEELAYDGTNYDAWFSLARLEEDAYGADKEDGEDVEPTRVREVYERAVANIPPATEKRYVAAPLLLPRSQADIQIMEKIHRMSK
jgi:crooked neck